MSKEMRELLNKINAKKAEIKALVEDGKIEDAKSAKEELKDMQEAFNVLADLDDGDTQQAQQHATDGNAQTVAGEKNGLSKQIKAFTNAIKAAWKKTEVSPEDREVLNAMSEGNDNHGGDSSGSMPA